MLVCSLRRIVARDSIGSAGLTELTHDYGRTWTFVSTTTTAMEAPGRGAYNLTAGEVTPGLCEKAESPLGQIGSEKFTRRHW